MTRLTLVTGARAADRERAIAAALVPGRYTAIILEGLADANSPLVYDESDASADGRPQVIRIAPGCLCCAGHLVLRVTLHRILRRPPAQLFISLADASHLERLRASLSSAPYDALLHLSPDLAVL
ncbi:GTPase [Massilia sp. MB5]|uniref:hypothetical protein n=1 Tax=unclassified Massilia TaxID=2609279 RepID=UPI00067CC7D8|nr:MULTISPECIES: hypothetical protein [unclassified Massilia]AKU22576.1 GTPase [Massilia sp. NR 4-1]UMR32641.1 GTPase [Massilia sp. MB5]